MQTDFNPRPYDPSTPPKFDENPYGYTGSPSTFPTTESPSGVGEGQIALAWFVFWLMATFGGAFIGGIVGLIMGLAMAAQGIPPQQIGAYATVVGFVLGIPISYICFRLAVGLLILPQTQQVIDDARRTASSR